MHNFRQYSPILPVGTGKVITSICMGTSKDVDIAVKAAREAFTTRWGLNCPGFERGRMLIKLAELMEECADELAAIESLDNGTCIAPICSNLVHDFGSQERHLAGRRTGISSIQSRLSGTSAVGQTRTRARSSKPTKASSPSLATNRSGSADKSSHGTSRS